MFNNSKVLVAGGSGFIGSNLILRLLQEGSLIRATYWKNEPQVKNDSIEYIKCDLTKMDNCKRALDGMDYVFMCAANTSGAAVMRKTPLAHVTPNVLINTQILAAAYEANVKKFLFISSSAAYPPSDNRPVKEEEMFDGDPFEVYYSVGWMKRYAEILCRIYAQKIKNPMSTVIVRPSNAYGPFDKFDPQKSHVTAATIRKVVTRQKPIEVWGTGEDLRDLIYINDLIEGMILAMKNTKIYNEFNIAAEKIYSIKDLLQTTIKLDNYEDAEVIYDPSKPTTIPVRVIDCSKARRELNFSAKISLEEGLSRTIDWYKAHFQ
ncbi:MAG TPA: NAD-dependent epimerase/dehydratase family protein [Anaerolineae bacterium]|nr:NAD-dependent epimerase/dehydratase family protein [Anaerolineae bacterium]